MATQSVVAATINAGTWTASSSTPLFCIQTNGDGNYIISPISNTSAFITIPDFGLTDATINAVRVKVVARISAAGSRSYTAGIRVNGVVTMTGGSQAINTTNWSTYTWEWLQNPETNAAWTTADLDAITRVYLTDDAAGLSVEVDYIEVEADYTNVTPGNNAPTAVAGADQTGVEPYEIVTLNGSASTDSDGTIIDYVWVQVGGSPTVDLEGSGHSRTFAAPATINGTSLEFELTVTDDEAATDTDTCTVEILPHTWWLIDSGVAEHPIRSSIIE